MAGWAPLLLQLSWEQKVYDRRREDIERSWKESGINKGVEDCAAGVEGSSRDTLLPVSQYFGNIRCLDFQFRIRLDSVSNHTNKEENGTSGSLR